MTAGVDPSWDPGGRHEDRVLQRRPDLHVHGRQLFARRSRSSPARSPHGRPTGRTIAYESGGGISVIPAGGGTANFVPATGTAPSWSPDGEHDRVRRRRATASSRARDLVVRAAGRLRRRSPGDRATRFAGLARRYAERGARISAPSRALLSTVRWRCSRAARQIYAIHHAVGTSSTYAVSSADVEPHHLRRRHAANAAGSTSPRRRIHRGRHHRRADAAGEHRSIR